MSGRRYTPEDDAFIGQHIGLMKYADIGKVIGRSRLSVSRRVAHLNLNTTWAAVVPRRHNLAVYHEVATLRVAGFSHGRIGKRLGLSRNTVKDIARRISARGMPMKMVQAWRRSNAEISNDSSDR